jgi:DNA-binding transcriptional MocR family regulator
VPARGENEGFVVLNELVCDAIPAPGVPRASARAESEGMTIVPELVYDAGGAKADDLDSALKAEAARLAALISTSADPTGSAARFQKLLADELDTKRREK